MVKVGDTLGFMKVDPSFGKTLEQLAKKHTAPFVLPQPLTIPVALKDWYLCEMHSFTSFNDGYRIVIEGAGTFYLNSATNSRARLVFEFSRLQRENTITFTS